MCPQAQSVQLPSRWPLMAVPSNRYDATTEDSKLVNGIIEKVSQEDIWIYKRPGLVLSSTIAGSPVGRGNYNWRGNIYAVFGTTLYKDGVSVGTVNATNGSYRFASVLGATPKLVLGDGVKAYTYETAGGLVQITDADFPTAFVKGFAYLDGTLYVMDANANIKGSDINDPTAWDALNTIQAQIEPDRGVALAKQLVYVLALKEWTTEVFYDAANPTGSPLSPVQGSKINFGCMSADTIQEIDGILFWAATNRTSGVQVVMVDKLTPRIISTKPIERLLDEINYTDVRSWSFRHDGHIYYGLTFITSNRTFVYDAREDAWYQWADTDENYFPIVSATFDASLNHYLQHGTNGKTYDVSDTQYTDDGSLITVDVVTPNFDGGTRRKKNMTSMEFIGDQVTGSVINVRCSDDDYQSWTNFRNVSMANKRAFLTGCGTFRRRAYHLRHRKNTAFRIKAAEMQLDLGTL